jgi:hypothetical protein
MTHVGTKKVRTTNVRRTPRPLTLARPVEALNIRGTFSDPEFPTNLSALADANPRPAPDQAPRRDRDEPDAARLETAGFLFLVATAFMAERCRAAGPRFFAVERACLDNAE